jgi:hypothetical protein
MIFVDSIDQFHPTNNYVLFRPDWEDEEVVRIAGIKMWIDTRFEKGMHAPVGGTVMKCPSRIVFDPTAPVLDYDTDMEIQDGDFITVEFHEVFSAIENSEQRRVYVGDEKCLLVRYDRLIGAVRGDRVIPLNGYIFAEPLPPDDVSEFEIVEFRQKQHHQNAAIVKHVGQKVRRYWWDRDYGCDTLEVTVGEKIYFINHADVLVEHDYHRKMFDTPMFRIRRKHIIGKHEKNN